MSIPEVLQRVRGLYKLRDWKSLSETSASALADGNLSREVEAELWSLCAEAAKPLGQHQNARSCWEKALDLYGNTNDGDDARENLARILEYGYGCERDLNRAAELRRQITSDGYKWCEADGRGTIGAQPSERLADTRMNLLLAEMADVKKLVAELIEEVRYRPSGRNYELARTDFETKVAEAANQQPPLGL